MANPWFQHFLHRLSEQSQACDNIIRDIIPGNIKETNAREQAIGMQKGLEYLEVLVLEQQNSILWKQQNLNSQQTNSSPIRTPEEEV